jgi:hypothetical protein
VSNLASSSTARASRVEEKYRGGGASMVLDALYLSVAVLLTPYFLYRKFIKKNQSAGWKNKINSGTQLSAPRNRASGYMPYQSARRLQPRHW